MAPRCQYHRHFSSHFITLLFLALDISQAFCPYLQSSGEDQNAEAAEEEISGRRHRDRALYDSLSYYSEDDQTCPNNCFMNDGGNLEAHHQASDGSTLSTFDVMSELSENDGGSDMCVFSMQELRLPNNQISAENLLGLIYLGDGGGRRMHEFAQSNSDNILLAACTVGRIGATEACSNANQGVEGYDYYASDGATTYYKDRFCKSALKKSKIDHPHSITIFKLNSNDLENAEYLLGEFREAHATNMAWAYETEIGAGGHMLAKVVPCDQISEKFKNPSNAYLNLADDNSVCDYIGSNGKQFAAEALHEWESICSVWPRNKDGSTPQCHKSTKSLSIWMVACVAGFLLAVGAALLLHKQTKLMKSSSVDKRQLITEMT